MLELYSVASGSSGNCICVGTDNTHVLIDAGVSGKRIENGLNMADLCCKDLEGILITHEHIDHIAGLGVLARRYGIPMYATAGTIEAILHTKSVGQIDPQLFRAIEPKENFIIGDMTFHPIAISHDAADPVAYRFESGEHKMAVMTDLGNYDQNIVDELQGLDALLLEANHDVRMLQLGSYPYPLKQRILGERGHLSNERSGQLLGEMTVQSHVNRNQTLALGGAGWGWGTCRHLRQPPRHVSRRWARSEPGRENPRQWTCRYPTARLSSHSNWLSL